MENAEGMGIATRKTTEQAAPEQTRAAGAQADPRRCDGCGRVPLVGESIAHYKSGAVRCDLCRSMHHREQPVSEALVKHAPDGPHSRVRVIRRLPS